MQYEERVPKPKKALNAKNSARATNSVGGQGRVAQKPFAVFDLDGTLVRWQLYHSIVDKLNKMGFIDPADFESVYEARLDWKKRKPSASFSKYEATLVKTYQKVLSTITYEVFLKAAKAAFDEHKDQVYTYSRELVSELKKKGYTLLAISGSQIEIVEMVARYWGFDDWAGSQYELKDDRFTGRVFVASNDKKKILANLIEKHGLSKNGSIALGDSENDISMLEFADKPIAFNPTKNLFDHATKAGWDIVIERKKRYI